MARRKGVCALRCRYPTTHDAGIKRSTGSPRLHQLLRCLAWDMRRVVAGICGVHLSRLCTCMYHHGEVGGIRLQLEVAHCVWPPMVTRCTRALISPLHPPGLTQSEQRLTATTGVTAPWTSACGGAPLSHPWDPWWWFGSKVPFNLHLICLSSLLRWTKME